MAVTRTPNAAVGKKQANLPAADVEAPATGVGKKSFGTRGVRYEAAKQFRDLRLPALNAYGPREFSKSKPEDNIYLARYGVKPGGLHEFTTLEWHLVCCALEAEFAKCHFRNDKKDFLFETILAAFAAIEVPHSPAKFDQIDPKKLDLILERLRTKLAKDHLQDARIDHICYDILTVLGPTHMSGEVTKKKAQGSLGGEQERKDIILLKQYFDAKDVPDAARVALAAKFQLDVEIAKRTSARPRDQKPVQGSACRSFEKAAAPKTRRRIATAATEVATPAGPAGKATKAPRPELPPGLSWPKGDYGDSPEGQGQGNVVDYLRRVWLPILEVGRRDKRCYVDRRIIADYYPGIISAIGNFRRPDKVTGVRKEIPENLRFPTEKQVNDSLLTPDVLGSIKADPRLAQVVASRIRQGTKIPGL